MPEEIFGKNELEIEAEISRRLQMVAKEAAEAATHWVDSWQNDRVTVKRKVINSLNEKLEQILLQALSAAVITQAQAHVRDALKDKFTEEYITTHPEYQRAMRDAESEFWRDFNYKMRDTARKAGTHAAQATSAAYERSMTTLIKRSVLAHFEASEALAEVEKG